MRIIYLLKRHALVSSAALIIMLISVNSLIIYYNELILARTNEIIRDTEHAKGTTSQIWNQSIRNSDIGLRGYAITKDEKMLSPLHDSKKDHPQLIKSLREILKKQKFKAIDRVDSLNLCAEKFIEACEKMVQLISEDKMDEFRTALKADPGKDAWFSYYKNEQIINAFEDSLFQEAFEKSEKANKRSKIIQWLLVIIGLPTLFYMIYKINIDRKAKRNLFLKLEQNNRQYLFNPGTPIEIKDEDLVIENSIKNFQKAKNFISRVSTGDYSADWQGIDGNNISFNKENLAGELLQMREKMKTIKAQEEIRSWTTEGLAKFSEVIRQHQDNVDALSFDILVFLTKYMNAQQGCFFIVREDEEEKRCLELSACYAFNKKKHLTKRVEIGQGLIGQTFREGQSVMLTEIPTGYTQITSGLGELTPTCLIVVPMKYNDNIEAVIELAGFKKFEKHEIEFLEKVGETTASTLGSVKNTEKMRTLIDQFKIQTEEMKAQEEEMRQNMEEMQATQEALKRQEREVQEF